MYYVPNSITKTHFNPKRLIALLHTIKRFEIIQLIHICLRNI